MSEGQHCLVHVRVRAETGFGQVVAIGGSSNALGGFRLTEVVELVTTPEAYPIWFTEKPLVLSKGKEVQYKYGIVEGGLCKSFELGRCRTFIPFDADSYTSTSVLKTAPHLVQAPDRHQKPDHTEQSKNWCHRLTPRCMSCRRHRRHEGDQMPYQYK